MDQLVGGHEGIGIITEIGAEAGYTGLSVGDRVGMGFLSKTCKSCEMCTTGDEAYCPRQIPTGFKCDGTFQRTLDISRLPADRAQNTRCSMPST